MEKLGGKRDIIETISSGIWNRIINFWIQYVYEGALSPRQLMLQILSVHFRYFGPVPLLDAVVTCLQRIWLVQPASLTVHTVESNQYRALFSFTNPNPSASFCPQQTPEINFYSKFSLVGVNSAREATPIIPDF